MWFVVGPVRLRCGPGRALGNAPTTRRDQSGSRSPGRPAPALPKHRLAARADCLARPNRTQTASSKRSQSLLAALVQTQAQKSNKTEGRTRTMNTQAMACARNDKQLTKEEKQDRANEYRHQMRALRPQMAIGNKEARTERATWKRGLTKQGIASTLRYSSYRCSKTKQQTQARTTCAARAKRRTP